MIVAPAFGQRATLKAIAIPMFLFALAGPCLALVEIPYTRQAMPVQCRPGACFYVDGENGSDRNDGKTLQSAWKTLQAASDKITGGSTVLVANGNYSGGVGVLPITKSGTSAAWTTFAALPGHRPVIHVPQGAYWGIGIPNAHHVLIDGFEISGPALSQTYTEVAAAGNNVVHPLYSEICVAIGGGPDFPAPRDIIIRNTTLHHCGGGGIMHFASDAVHILNNWIYDNGWWTINGGAGINLIHQTDAGSAEVGGYRSYVVGNLLERNRNYFAWRGSIFADKTMVCDGNAIIVDENLHDYPAPSHVPYDLTGVPYTGRTYIANNIIRDTGAHAIVSHKSSRVDIVNNTAYNNLLTNSNCLQGEITVYNSSDVRVQNNVVINLSGKLAVEANSGTLDFNIWNGGVEPNTQLGSNDVQLGALLAAPMQGSYNPTSTSPAIGSGSSPLAPAVDFFGNPRVATGIDRGAIQVYAWSFVTYSAINCIFDWGERTFPSQLHPAATSQVSAPYYYRYFSGTNTYVGVSLADWHLYLLMSAGLSDLGLVINWLPQIGCQQ